MRTNDDITWKVDPSGEYRPFTWAKVGDELIMTLSQAGPIPDEIFDDYLADLRSLRGRRLLGTAIGSIDVTASQRKAASDIMKGWAVAIITDSAVARGVATALKWLGLNIRGYNWSDVETAITNLAVPGWEVQRLVHVLDELTQRSGGRTLGEVRYY
ncbi:MAG: hypothetical protein AAGF11_31930 [Myxococcota bacterium]